MFNLRAFAVLVLLMAVSVAGLKKSYKMQTQQHMRFQKKISRSRSSVIVDGPNEGRTTLKGGITQDSCVHELVMVKQEDPSAVVDGTCIPVNRQLASQCVVYWSGWVDVLEDLCSQLKIHEDGLIMGMTGADGEELMKLINGEHPDQIPQYAEADVAAESLTGVL